MDRIKKMKALLKFYESKLGNKYYENEEEKIFIEEKIKHFRNILGGINGTL